LEVSLLYIAGAVLLVGEADFVIGGAGGDHVVEDVGEFVGGGGDGLGRAKLGAFAAKKSADMTIYLARLPAGHLSNLLHLTS
jgi:hypothetical protein